MWSGCEELHLGSKNLAELGWADPKFGSGQVRKKGQGCKKDQNRSG